MCVCVCVCVCVCGQLVILTLMFFFFFLRNNAGDEKLIRERVTEKLCYGYFMLKF